MVDTGSGRDRRDNVDPVVTVADLLAQNTQQSPQAGSQPMVTVADLLKRHNEPVREKSTANRSAAKTDPRRSSTSIIGSDDRWREEPPDIRTADAIPRSSGEREPTNILGPKNAIGVNVRQSTVTAAATGAAVAIRARPAASTPRPTGTRSTAAGKRTGRWSRWARRRASKPVVIDDERGERLSKVRVAVSVLIASTILGLVLGLVLFQPDPKTAPISDTESNTTIAPLPVLPPLPPETTSSVVAETTTVVETTTAAPTTTQPKPKPSPKVTTTEPTRTRSTTTSRRQRQPAFCFFFCPRR